MTFTIEYEREDDGRWLAEVIELPGPTREQITERTTDLLKNSATRPGHKEEGDNWKHNSEKKETP